MFQKFHSPNQLKYLMGDFSKVSTHPKQQLLLKKLDGALLLHMACFFVFLTTYVF
jgi:hypothetical protein